jgi:hypothetical protein
MRYITFVITDSLVLSKDIGLKVNNVEKDCLKESITMPFRAWNKKIQIGLSQTL